MYIQSRFYRAPEVILGARYSCEIDMWSLGCILVELYTGQPLFCGQTEADQIQAIQTTLGALPQALLLRGHADKLQRLRPILLESGGDSACSGPKPGKDIRSILEAKPVSYRTGNEAPGTSGPPPGEFAEFLDLVQGMLQLDPQRRLKPAEAFAHPFFTQTPSPVVAPQSYVRPPQPQQPQSQTIPRPPRVLRQDQ